MDRRTIVALKYGSATKVPEKLAGAPSGGIAPLGLHHRQVFSCTYLLLELTQFFLPRDTPFLHHVGRAPTVAHSLPMSTIGDPSVVADIETTYISSIHSKMASWTRSLYLTPSADEQCLPGWEVSKVLSAQSADILNIRYRQARASYTPKARGRVSILLRTMRYDLGKRLSKNALLQAQSYIHRQRRTGKHIRGCRGR